jgi:alkylation response protein AidB-like acyl-CoA dehydrogenase
MSAGLTGEIGGGRADPDVRSSPLERARAIGPAIRASADEIERTRRIPEPLLTGLHASGLFRLLLPRAYGGGEVEPGQYLAAIIEVSRHDASIGWNMFVANSSALIAPHLPQATAAEIFGNPRTIIAWGPPNACRAMAVPGGYRVSGRWDFASGCRQALWMGMHGHVEEADGSLRLNAAGRPTVRTLLFPAGNANLIDTWNTIGLRGTASDSYTVEDLFVPEAYSGTREDPSGRNIAGPLYAFTMQGLYAVGVAGVGLGAAREMLSELVRLGATKTPRGLARLADQPLVQSEVARAEARLGSAESYLRSVLAEIYARADHWGAIATEDRALVRLACANAIQGAIEVADTIYKAAGVDAIFPGSPFERRFRDIHTLSQQIQSRGAHFEAVGRILLGTPDPFFM